MRGTSCCQYSEESYGGLIPAGAGNIMPATPGQGTRRAHPRGCGEHAISHTVCFWAQGSSPRVRGTYRRGHQEYRLPGLIPAGAGNMRSIVPRSRSIWAHPRGCGEHNLGDVFARFKVGSSPRVRGTCLSDYEGVLGRGLIPAGAGNIPHFW